MTPAPATLRHVTLTTGHVHESPRAEVRAETLRTLAPLLWRAARIEVGAAVYPEAMSWTGDFERCLAWTWIARGEPVTGELRDPPRPQRPARPPPTGPVRRAMRRR